MTSFFITGTDTDCGKTYVTRLLINYFRQQKVNCIGLKPIASGCEWQQGQWMNEDIKLLMEANQSNLVINGWLFQPPVAPHFVALDEGIEIRAKEVVSFCTQPRFMSFQLRLIEGAGGLMVPLNETETWIDMVKLAEIPIIVVVGIRLGCINHALLINEVIQAHQLPVAGWIANVVDDKTIRIEDNINDIKNRIDIPLIATVSHHATHLNTTPMMEKLCCLI